MFKKIQKMILAAGLVAVGANVTAFAQAEHGKMEKMGDRKMSHEDMTAKMDKMSAEDKAMMIDKMSVKDKSAAMKAGGQDASKMSSQEKADMFDKMPADKKMKMMKAHGSKMHKDGKMDHMEKP